ncbi:MAG: hypothetical protein Q9187_009315, partial [Circinaria calcarea]
MAPSATQVETAPKQFNAFRIPNKLVGSSQSVTHYVPLQLSGILEEYDQKELTPLFGTVFPNINLAEILHSPERDEKIRDLVITISQRGVCVFPGQADLTIEDQKLLGRKLGELTYRPHTSGLAIHPLNQTTMPDGSVDVELTILARDPSKKLVLQAGFSQSKVKKQSHADGWHTDNSFEFYDILSEPYQKFLEGLTATFMPPGHSPSRIVDRIWPGSRGSPENIGPELHASHPAVRTNPVTGWKYVYAMGHHHEAFDGLGDIENKMIIEYMDRLVTENHQLQ